MTRKALQRFKAWVASHWEKPRRDGQFLSSGSLSVLGAAEQPPQGFFRKLGFHTRMLGRRIRAEARAEWPYVLPRLLQIVLCLIFQYVHAIFTGMAYYMHTPLPEDNTTLHDLGFEALPYLSVDAVSEVLVYTAFAAFFIWLLSPFVRRHKSFYSVVVFKRVLVIVVSCQILRILTFLSTQIPAPAPHCRRPEPTADVGWPVWWKVIIVNVARQASKSCGDLIFSSHLTFVLAFTWVYAYMGQYLLLKVAGFLYAAATGLCIIASRKHYTVDVVVAAYVVPLVAFHYFRHWTVERDEMCTSDSRSIVCLREALPVTAAGAGAQQANGRSAHGGSVHGGSSGGMQEGNGSKHVTSSWPEEHAAGQQQQQQERVGAADLEAGAGLQQVELTGRSSAALEAGYGSGGEGGSPVMQQAWNTLADLPRRLSSRTQHRRTESSDSATMPVLAMEDRSAR